MLKKWSLNETIPDLKQQQQEPNCGSDKGDSCSGQGMCSEGGGGCGSRSGPAPPPSREEVLSRLCYGCRLVGRSMDVFPPFLVEGVAKAIRRDRAKEEIQDFLL